MMKLSQLLRGIQVRESSADMEMEISGVSYDSRKTVPGDLFVAMAGYETDGHKFIPIAREKGAVCVLCQEKPQGEGPYVLVEDSRLALAQVGQNWYGDPAASMKMIGVTGTNGKTTTTYLLKDILEQAAGAKVGLIGTNQNMIGDEVLPTERTTPESLELQELFARMRDAGCTHVVMEASSHALFLKRVYGIRFRVGVFTNLTQDHLDFHGDMRSYAEAKAKLMGMCRYAVVNLDDEWSQFMLRHVKSACTTFSLKDSLADVYGQNVRYSSSAVSFMAACSSEAQSVTLHIPGTFSAYNALTVLACSISLGIDLASCASALDSARGVKGRMETVPTDGDYTILIDYAHTPDALENVLRSIREVARGRLVALFGCGGDRDRKKRPIMGRIAAELADLVVVTSDNPRTEQPEAIIADILEGMKDSATPRQVITDRIEAIAWAIEHHRPGDVIVLAGKGHEDYQIVGHEKHHMDEREIVAEILEKRKNRK